ncbi:hypothetical protein ABIE56_003440 [Luteibacter sp. 621]|uniref:hypothetical protein n=1 Tax=Luteibacter sp. 621 TaxID=3373916 RepID=UPI003D1BEE57
MPDIVVRHIDEQMAERIKQLARERRWSINEVILHALRYGLGLSAGDVFSELLLEPGDIAHLTGAWDADEQAAFQEALAALSQASPATLSEAAKAYERGAAAEPL